MGNLAHLLEVLGDVGDELAGLVVVEVAERELLDVVEGLAAHLGLDRDAEGVAPVVHDRLQPGVEDVDAEQQGGGAGDQPPVLSRQQLVDKDLHGDREGELKHAGQHGTAEIEEEQMLVGQVIGKEAAQHG